MENFVRAHGQGPRASLEHRRRLDSIISAQAADVSRDGEIVIDNWDQFEPSEEHRHSNRFNRLTELRLSQNQRVLPLSCLTVEQPPPLSQDSDTNVTSFERIKPAAAAASTSPGRHSRTSQIEKTDASEFSGKSRKPFLNKAGGTYMPPEDFY